MVLNAETLILIFVAVWVSVLTFLLFRMIGHYNRLTQGISKAQLKEILEALLTTQKKTVNQVADIDARLVATIADGGFHIQRAGLVRFNPFSDTGGSQSFTFALLDGHANGVVMTSLYGRTGNRWYIKEVHGGKGKEVALSKEEQLAIQKASQVKE